MHYAQFIGVGSDKDQLLRIWTGVQVGARLGPDPGVPTHHPER